MKHYLTTDELIRYILKSRFNSNYDEHELSAMSHNELERIYNDIIDKEMTINNLITEILDHPDNTHTYIELSRYSIAELYKIFNELYYGSNYNQGL